MVAIVDTTIRLISLQFSCTNRNVVPPSVGFGGSETAEEHNKRRERANGTLVVGPTKNVSLVEFLDDLGEAGYELVDAFYQRRTNPKSGRGYYMIRFLFCRHEHVEISQEFRDKRSIILTDLEELCERATWQVRAFLNPCLKDGEEIPGQKAISVNLGFREPLFRSDGQRVEARLKDKKGRSIGVPVLLRPDYSLCIFGNGAIVLR